MDPIEIIVMILNFGTGLSKQSRMIILSVSFG